MRAAGVEGSSDTDRGESSSTFEYGLPAPVALVAADSPLVQQWACSLATQAFPTLRCHGASTIRAALNIVLEQVVNLALIDTKLRDGSGIVLIQQIVAASPATVCIVVTENDDDGLTIAAFSAGAKGFLINDQPPDFLVEQLRRLPSGVPPLSPTIARRLVRHFAELLPRMKLPRTNDSASLTSREEEVLQLIAKGLQIEDVARGLNISRHTVCSHIKSIYRKRNLSSRAEAALEARHLQLV